MKRFLCLTVAASMLLAVQTAWADDDCHFTILNKTGEKINLAFWGASGWSSRTDPITLFTGSSGEGTEFFDPYPGQGGEFDVGHARKSLNVAGRGTLLLNHYDPELDPNEGRFELAADGNGDFVLAEPGYAPSLPFALLPEFFGNDKDLFAVAISNEHFAWAGMLLHNAGNGDGKDAWTNTLRSLIYTYYYKYAYGTDFLFLPPKNGGWYVHTGGGSDDLLWAALAAIGYKELSMKYNNGMDKDVYRHQNGLLVSGDSNRGYCGSYITISDHRRCFQYLNDSGYYYCGKEGGVWLGIPWKDHCDSYERNVNYKSINFWQRASSEHDGFNFRASISNGLFWLYSARLLKHAKELRLGADEMGGLEDAIVKEYGLFFERCRKYYVCHENQPEFDPLHPVDRIGLIRDGVHYPQLCYVDGYNSCPDPGWEQRDGDFNTWTYNTGVILGCLGESYLADPSEWRATKYLLYNGLDLANAALDRLSWQNNENAPKGVICEIENEVRDYAPNRDMIVFKGALALFIGDFAQALHDAIVNGHINTGKDLERAKRCYKRISGVIRGTSNFLAFEWGLSPPAAWVWHDSPYLIKHPERAGSNSITQGSAAAAHVTAGRLADWDEHLVNNNYITDPDEFLIYR